MNSTPPPNVTFSHWCRLKPFSNICPLVCHHPRCIFFSSVHSFFCMTAAHQVNSNANFANFDAFGNTAIPSHLNTSPPSKSLSSGTIYPSIAFLPYCHPLIVFFFMWSIQGLSVSVVAAGCKMIKRFHPQNYWQCLEASIKVSWIYLKKGVNDYSLKKKRTLMTHLHWISWMIYNLPVRSPFFYPKHLLSPAIKTLISFFHWASLTKLWICSALTQLCGAASTLPKRRVNAEIWLKIHL